MPAEHQWSESAAECLKAVSRAHWRTVKSALERDGFEYCGAEEWSRDLAEWEPISDVGN